MVPILLMIKNDFRFTKTLVSAWILSDATLQDERCKMVLHQLVGSSDPGGDAIRATLAAAQRLSLPQARAASGQAHNPTTTQIN